MNYRLRFSSRAGQVTFGFLIVAAALFVAAIWYSDGTVQMLINLPFPAAVLVWGWWTWLWPAVLMSDGGLVLRNQLRTHYLPWSVVTGAESRFGLYVSAGGKRFLAAGVPARGGLTQSRESRETMPHLLFDKSVEQTVSVGPSIAARMIEEEKLYQDHPEKRPELPSSAQQNLRQWESAGQSAGSHHAGKFGESVTSTWNWLPLTLQAASIVAMIVTITVR